MRKSLKISFFKALLISVLYLLLMFFLTGIRAEHILLVVLCSSLYLVGGKAKKFILAFGVFVVFGVIYDLMRAFPNYWFNSIDIKNIYELEKSLFGINTLSQIKTPSEYFAIHHNTFFDFLSGFFYINWMPVPLAFAFYMFIKNKNQFLRFSLAFLITNIFGFIIYYIHPAAPPWYVSLYGFDLHTSIAGSTGGLSRFDELVHLNIFHSIYSKNSNVFAAMPSLHCAYPVVVLFYALKNKIGWVNILLTIFMAGIWFSAVYSGHHYVLDVIAGITCAFIGIFILEKILYKNKKINGLLILYEKAIS